MQLVASRLETHVGKPAFVDFRLSGTVLDYSIPNVRAFLEWLGVRITQRAGRYNAEYFAIHGLEPYRRLDDVCIAELLRRADRVGFHPSPEDLGMMLRIIALQDKVWGYGFYRPRSEIPSPKPEYAEEFWERWFLDWHRDRRWREDTVEPYWPDFLRSS